MTVKGESTALERCYLKKLMIQFKDNKMSTIRKIELRLGNAEQGYMQSPVKHPSFFMDIVNEKSLTVFP